MATYRATTDWTLAEPGEDFLKGRYSRGHAVTFGSGVEVPGTASPHVVGAKWSVANAVDPEEMLVGSIAQCHMLTFLHIAREDLYVVRSYRDVAIGEMTKRDDGEMWVSRVVLHPDIGWEGREPSAAEIAVMHERAHHMCFIANSVKTEIVVADPIGE
jgi:organic hydroperoxide reductase OsmC/OhrA